MPAGMIIKSPPSTSIRIQRSWPLCLIKIKTQIPSVNLFHYGNFTGGVIFSAMPPPCDLLI